MKTRKLLIITILMLSFLGLNANHAVLDVSDPSNDKLDRVERTSSYKGYIVTNNNDTLVGYIQMLSPIYNSIRVRFREEQEGQSKVFKSEELLAYAFKMNKALASMDSAMWMNYEKHYIYLPSIPFGTNEVLLYKAQSGKISVYHHFYESPLTPKEPIKMTLFIKVKDGQLIHLTKDNYKVVLSELTDNPTTKNSIETSKYNDAGYWINYLNNNE